MIVGCNCSLFVTLGCFHNMCTTAQIVYNCTNAGNLASGKSRPLDLCSPRRQQIAVFMGKNKMIDDGSNSLVPRLPTAALNIIVDIVILFLTVGKVFNSA